MTRAALAALAVEPALLAQVIAEDRDAASYDPASGRGGKRTA